MHLRFVFRVLFRDGRGDRFPAKPYAHFGRFGRVRELRALRGALFKRPYFAAVELILAIDRRHIGVRRFLLRQNVIFDSEVLVRLVSFELVTDKDAPRSVA